MALKRYLQTLQFNQKELVSSNEIFELRDKIKQLESIVYLTDITSLRDLIKLKHVELKSTLARFLEKASIEDASPAVAHRLSKSVLQQKESELRAFLTRTLGPHWKFDGYPSRYFFDMTQAISLDYVTGIQRVVREIAREGSRLGVLIPAFVVGKDVFFLPSSGGQLERVIFRPADTFILPDASWNYSDEVRRAMRTAKLGGAKTVSIVYDLVPLSFPDTCPPGLPFHFSRWFHTCLIKSDQVVCISRTVADETANYIDRLGVQNAPTISWFHLGSDLVDAGHVEKEITDQLSLLPSPVVLAVGTIEPRKGYDVLLDAMENLWDLRYEAQLVIVGRYGWASHLLEKRIANHEEFGKRLRWFNSASDAAVSALYRMSHTLVCASISEGFGLPIVEAARIGLPSIVSDIPVFREICGDDAIYFEAGCDDSLTHRLTECIKGEKRCPHINLLTWEQSTALLLQRIICSGESGLSV